MALAVSDLKSSRKFSANNVMTMSGVNAGNCAVSNTCATSRARLESMTRCITSAPAPLQRIHKVCGLNNVVGRKPVTCQLPRQQVPRYKVGEQFGAGPKVHVQRIVHFITPAAIESRASGHAASRCS